MSFVALIIILAFPRYFIELERTILGDLKGVVPAIVIILIIVCVMQALS